MTGAAASHAATLSATGVSYARGGATVLDSVSVVVGPGARVGLIGSNGVGKSTFLRILAGELAPDFGSVRRAPPDSTVGFLTQEPQPRAGESLMDELARRTGVADAEADLERTARDLASADDRAATEYAHALDRYLALGGPDFPARAAAVCDDLGLRRDGLVQSTATLSGGQAARASLASILLARFDTLLLDEPTNNLDLDGLARLEQFLGDSTGGLVVVSHDRAFLDRVVDRVVEIDEHTRASEEYGGGWAAFVEARRIARLQAQERYTVARERSTELRERARTQRQWSETAKSRERRKAIDGDKVIAHRRAERTERQASKVRSTQRAIERLETVEKPWEGWELNLELAAGSRSGDVVARLRDASVHYGDLRLGPWDVEIAWAERVAIAGPNGAGKTTMIGLLTGKRRPDAGAAYLGPGVVVGELDQTRERFSGAGSLLEVFARESGMPAGEARTLLAKFGLGADHVLRPAGTLSPGERTRAGLALLQGRGTNLLVLDEPTNHLDMPAIVQLERALDSWPGTLLLVSHDRALLTHVRIDRVIDVAVS